MVPPASRRVSRVPRYSGATMAAYDFAYTSFTFSGWLSQNHSAIIYSPISWSATPECMHSGLGSSPFARRYLGNRFFFLFLRVLRCFSSPGVPPISYVFTYRYLRVAQVGFPIRKSPDQCIFAAPRSISVLIPSFIGSWCQGIRPTPLIT